MPKALIRRYLPSPEKIREQRSLGFMRHRLGDPSVWHLNRRSASLAMFWGIFFAFMPMPFQMIPATLIAVGLRINLPMVLVLTWVTNPITVLPFMYVSYAFGSLILNVPMLSWAEIEGLMSAALSLSSQPASGSVMAQLKPFFVGTVILGVTLGSLGYVGMQGYWRWHVIRQWQARAAQRAQARQKSL
ncbi:MAG: DUF2062 domain-containing protein [Pseudomonadota bacterium]